MEALEALGGEPMARDPDRRVSIAPQTSRSLSDSTAELPPPVTVLPAVRRSRIVSPAPPRTPRPEKSSTTGDFIATLKARYPKGTVAHSRFTKALSIYAASSRDAAAAQLLSQEVGDIFVDEPGLARAFQSFFDEPGADPRRMSLDTPVKSPTLLDVLNAAPPPLGARVNGKGETVVRLKAPPKAKPPQDKHNLVGREVRKPYSEWCYSEWHFGDVVRCSRPGHYVIAWDERTGPIEFDTRSVIQMLSPDSDEIDDAVRHREKYEAFPVGTRVEVWWSESGNPEDGGWWDAVVSYAGDVYEVEWIDDPGVFHRADYQAVRAAGSSPARGAAQRKVWAPDARAAPAASYAMLGFGQPAAPEQAPPATGSRRAAAQEASRRIREQS